MQLIDQSVQLIHATPNPSFLVEFAARTCYASQKAMECDRCTHQPRNDAGEVVGDSSDVLSRMERVLCDKCIERNVRFLRNLRDAKPNAHLSVFEHPSATFRIVTNRGVSHELVRHRLMAVSQASTRYIGYGEDGAPHPVKFIRSRMRADFPDLVAEWDQALEHSAYAYLAMREKGIPPQVARAVLPNDLATELVVTANAREWRHIMKMRYSTKAHPDMQKIGSLLLHQLCDWFPTAFDDIRYE